MIFLASNLKFLRKRRKRTQDEVAFSIGVPRATLNNYESGLSEPKLERLITIAESYRFRLDELVRTDLSKLPESKLRMLEIEQ